MKGTEHFKDVIQNYLETRASYDELFAESFRKENKNIDECITYILTEVQRMGCAGLSDEEVYSLAVHYYDEDNIEVGKSINCQVVVNHTIELTEEEKAEARKKAIERYQAEEYRKLTVNEEITSVQPDAFVANNELILENLAGCTCYVVDFSGRITKIYTVKSEHDRTQLQQEAGTYIITAVKDQEMYFSKKVVIR